MAKIGVIIAIVVVLIVIVSGSLVLSGLLKFPPNSPNSGTTTVTGTPATNSNIQQKAPNVVSSTQVNQSLGSGWNQRAGASGSASNLSTATSITTFGLVNPGSNPYKTSLITGIRGMKNTHFSVFTPVTMSTQHLNPNLTVQQFEANLYEPSGNGFAALGYLQFGSSNNVTQVYQLINYSAHSYYNYSSVSSSKIYLTNGKNYLYQWAQKPFGNNNSLWNLSILIGTDGANLIGVFYFTPDNLSMTHFTSLLNAEITKLSNPSANPINNVFITTSQVDAQTGISFNNTFSALIGINNGTAMFNEYAKAYNIETSSLTPSERLLINDTVGNLTLIGMSEFNAGEYVVNQSTPYGSYSYSMPIETVTAIANFSNTNVPSAIFFGMTQLTSNAPKGNVSTGNIGSGQYVYVHGPASTRYVNGVPQYTGNFSVIFSYQGSFLAAIMYTGHVLMNKTVMLNLLTEEYSYL